MNKKAASTGKVVFELAAPIVVWAVKKALEAPRVKKTLEAPRVKKTLKSADRKAKRNVKANRAFVTAGAAAVVLGLGLITRGAVKK